MVAAAGSGACSGSHGPLVYGTYVDEVLGYVVGAGAQVQRYYPHYNHLYSVAALTDSTGAVTERFTYNAYGKQKITDASGNVTRAKSSVGWDRGFTGYVADSESGLAYARNRMYSPILGRFIGRDPYRDDYSRPNPEDGYVDGLSLYMAYMVPDGVDPAGLKCGTTPKAVYVASGDEGGGDDPGAIYGTGNPHSVGSSATSLVSVVSKIANQVNDCECIKYLEIIGHGNSNGVDIAGRKKDENGNQTGWFPRKVKPRKTGSLRDTELNAKNAAAFAKAINGLTCFCKPCTIKIASCNVGSGALPQALANATGCSVIAATGSVYTKNPGEKYADYGIQGPGDWVTTNPQPLPVTMPILVPLPTIPVLLP